MPTTFLIPRLTDSEIFESLKLVIEAFANVHPFSLVITVFDRSVPVPQDSKLVEGSDLDQLLKLGSVLATRFQLKSQGGQNVCYLDRALQEPFDKVTFDWSWIDNVPTLKASGVQFQMRLLARLRHELRTSEVDAVLDTTADAEWSQYRVAQASALRSLQDTAKNIITDVARTNADLERVRTDRFAELTSRLRDDIESERKQLLQEHESRVAALLQREQLQDAKEKKFETQDARFLARKKQQDQIKQLETWLEGWGLTRDTQAKRWPVFIAYVASMFATLILTIWGTHHSYMLLDNLAEVSKLQWWQWLAISLKTVFPFAAFTTFTVYFIRWSSEWAKRHAEEEFRNRNRLIDIGRSGWLLEAVRDAQEVNASIPDALLKELSKNIFMDSANPDSEIHPSAVSDLLLQGLKTLRIKTADGSEVEATRAGK